ncbi:RNA dependent RNA polymerase-domain-containing protein [Scleroderma citrinum]
MAMEFDIRNVDTKATKYMVTKCIAEVLHKCPGPFVTDEDQRLPNFEVTLNEGNIGGIRNDGTGTFTVTRPVGNKFYRLYRLREIAILVGDRELRFYPNSKPVKRNLALTLEKAPFINPDIEQKRQEKLNALQGSFVVAKVQIGYSLSIVQMSLWIDLEEYQLRKALVRVRLQAHASSGQIGDPMVESTRYSIVVRFDRVRKLAIGRDYGNPYICFDLLTPPIFQQEDIYRPEDIDYEKSYRQRVCALDNRHAAIALYAYHLRIVLFDDSDGYRGDVLERFACFCKVAGLQLPIRGVEVDASSQKFFSQKELAKVAKWLRELSTNWRVAFQIEALLRNGTANTVEVLDLKPRIDELVHRHRGIAGEIMRHFVKTAANRPPVQSLQKCFETVLQGRRRRLGNQEGRFFCHHVTFTPTRLLLEGPNITQSNRVIREYHGYQDFFLRVDFRDEDRLQYRWDRDIDATSYLQGRVGTVLKTGFELAGRHFDFLAYSQSALRSHAVWFVSPFNHHEKGLVTAGTIRAGLGDFQEVIFSPSKFGARMAQAFTATDPSVRIAKHQWRDIPDIEENGIIFTDGVGTISQELSTMIWDALCKNYSDGGVNSVQPSAYQIRFLGYKGVVSVDPQLEGICMCLRPSMRKFVVPWKDDAEIEIAGAFGNPKTPHLNRPLVMVLEDRGASKQAFLDLQNDVVSKTRRAHESVELFVGLLEMHNLCRDYWLAGILKRLNTLGLELKPNHLQKPLDTSFLARIRSCAINHVLRYVKYRARIPIPDSYMLVGVADEGPAYVKRGHTNVYCLQQGRIFACIQNPGEEPKWIKGMCLISRSPVIHPGDVQRVYAIGKPPGDQLCLFAHLRNVVVFATTGTQSLPNSLGGGDLDGDTYEVIQHGPLLVPEHHNPASYPPSKPFKLDTPSTIDDVCDFIVEYINSDVVGLVSDKHITIADQSSDGTLDQACLKLAELHSQAVDYPKNGNKVNIYDMPRQLIRFRPDWSEQENPNYRKGDYYESSRALGYMYRNIDLEEVPDSPSTTEPVLSDPISKALRPLVQRQLRGQMFRTDRDWIDSTYEGYQEELTYISTTFSLSNSPLREEELVIGTILANCSNERYKKDRVYEMKESLSFLVKGIKQELIGQLDETEVKGRLARGWDAWSYSLEKASHSESGKLFGLRSFGLIALGLLLDSLEKLGGLPPL